MADDTQEVKPQWHHLYNFYMDRYLPALRTELPKWEKKDHDENAKKLHAGIKQLLNGMGKTTAFNPLFREALRSMSKGELEELEAIYVALKKGVFNETPALEKETDDDWFYSTQKGKRVFKKRDPFPAQDRGMLPEHDAIFKAFAKGKNREGKKMHILVRDSNRRAYDILTQLKENKISHVQSKPEAAKPKSINAEDFRWYQSDDNILSDPYTEKYAKKEKVKLGYLNKDESEDARKARLAPFLNQFRIKAENIGMVAFHPPDYPGPRGEKTRKLLQNMSKHDMPGGKKDPPVRLSTRYRKWIEHLKKDFKPGVGTFGFKIGDEGNDYKIQGETFLTKDDQNNDKKENVESFFSDYDLHGIYDADSLKKMTQEGTLASSPTEEKFYLPHKTGDDPEFKEKFKDPLNTEFRDSGPNIDMIHHADQDRWDRRSILGISPPVTVYAPNGTAHSLASQQEMILFYRDVFGMDLETYYKK
jgi:hypothetical protein